MPHTQRDKSVIAWHRESDEWGVVLAATRDDDSQKVYAFVATAQHSATFATCPFMYSPDLLRLSTANIESGKRKKLLQNVIDQQLESLNASLHVLQIAQTGLISNITSLGWRKEATRLVSETPNPAFRWLCRASDAQEKGMKTFELLLHLWEKHELGKFSQDQHEDAYLRRLMGK